MASTADTESTGAMASTTSTADTADTESTSASTATTPATAAPQHHVASVCTDANLLNKFVKVVEMIKDTPDIKRRGVSWVAIVKDAGGREAADRMRNRLQQLQWGSRTEPGLGWSTTLYNEEHLLCYFKVVDTSKASTTQLMEALPSVIKLFPLSKLNKDCKKAILKLMKEALPGTIVPQNGGSKRVAKIVHEASLPTPQGREPAYSYGLLNLLQYYSPAPDDEATRMELLERAMALRKEGARGERPLDNRETFIPRFCDVWSQHYGEGPDMIIDTSQSVEEQEEAMAQAGKFVQLAFFNLRRNNLPPSHIRRSVQRKIIDLKKELVYLNTKPSAETGVNKRKRTDDTAGAVAALEDDQAVEGMSEPDQTPEAGYEQHVRETRELERRNGYTGYLH
jgi:hypothetical protein